MSGESYYGNPDSRAGQGYDTNEINAHWTGQGRDPRAWGGDSYYEQDGKFVDGTNGADKDVERYRNMGATSQAGPQLDQTQANQARGLQMGSLGMLENAARGNAPSQAAIMGQSMGSQTMGAGLSAASAASGGPGSQLAGMRAAITGTTQANQQNAGQLMAMRNKESATDMGAFAHGASGVRGQDISAATTNAQLEGQQRALNEQRQQSFERMAFDTRNAELNAQMQQRAQRDAEEQAQRAARDAEEAAFYNKVKAVGNIGFGSLTSIMGAK
jgi:hypothetical protein